MWSDEQEKPNVFVHSLVHRSIELGEGRQIGPDLVLLVRKILSNLSPPRNLRPGEREAPAWAVLHAEGYPRRAENGHVKDRLPNAATKRNRRCLVASPLHAGTTGQHEVGSRRDRRYRETADHEENAMVRAPWKRGHHLFKQTCC